MRSAWWSNDGASFTRREVFEGYLVLEVADLDGDGDSDIVVVYYPVVTPRLEVLWNQGTSVFTPELITEVLGQFTKNSVRVFDVDEDGVLDIVAGPAASSAMAVAIYRGLPGGGFEAPVQQMLLHATYPSITSTFPQFGAADIDGDGDIDLVTNRLLQNNHRHDDLRGLHVQIARGRRAKAACVRSWARKDRSESASKCAWSCAARRPVRPAC